MKTDEWIWLGVGLGGQCLFSIRVFVQWWASEKQGKSVVPSLYWVFGLLGGMALLAYGCYRRDPVILLGQLLGTLVSFRNLMFVFQERGLGCAANRKAFSENSLRSILDSMTMGNRL